jgi:DNA-binding protein HU-beta
MTTTELVSRIAKKAGVTKKVAAVVARSLTAVIHESLTKDGQIKIAGIGTFRVVERKARSGVNPRTREKINIPALTLPRFMASKALKEAIKRGEQEGLALDVRDEVERLCREGNSVNAFDLAMKSLIWAREIFGNEDPRIAGCMVTVAQTAIHREKYYLAGQMYRKALSIQEKVLGPSHPDVVLCKRGLSDLERHHAQ